MNLLKRIENTAAMLNRELPSGQELGRTIVGLVFVEGKKHGQRQRSPGLLWE
jgi:hypothetical protein